MMTKKSPQTNDSNGKKSAGGYKFIRAEGVACELYKDAHERVKEAGNDHPEIAHSPLPLLPLLPTGEFLNHSVKLFTILQLV